MQTQVAKGRSEGERVVSLRRSASNESCGRKVMTLVHGVDVAVDAGACCCCSC